MLLPRLGIWIEILCGSDPVENPTTYEWSTCASYALGVPNRIIHFHPTYLSLSAYPQVRA